MSNTTNILLRYNYVAFPSPLEGRVLGEEAIATVLMNLSYYGRSLSVEGYNVLRKLVPEQLGNWWAEVEVQLKDITGASRKMGDFVVYKNFPKEVLDKDAAAYWLPQILMYWGFPKSIFTQEVKPREKMDEQPKCLVLKLDKGGALQDILNSLLKAPARWKEQELSDVLFLTESLPFDLGKLAFKENLVSLATSLMKQGKTIKLGTATDVLRLAVGLSDGDVSLREKAKLKSFKKAERRFLLSIMEGCNNLEEDVARRPELFKRLLHTLHPGDFKRAYPKVLKAMNRLYHDELTTFNSQVEQKLLAKDASVLDLLVTRPGDFRRRLVHTVNIFGKKAAKAFTAQEVLGKLTVAQIVSTRALLNVSNTRTSRIFPPKGNWGRAQLATPRPVAKTHLKTIDKALGVALAKRVPAVGVLDPATSMIKLPSNGEEGPFNRGTRFPIPAGTDFIRTASYWSVTARGYTWFDNGWNFFDQNWNPLGSCCWIRPKFPGEAWNQKANDPKTGAVFSGDPTIATGKACQMIDLYPEKLRAAGVRYAVWSVLCFSGMPFNKAEDVFAAFQWGKDANKGKLFEPARCQLAIPLKGDQLTKYVVLIDLEKNEMVYLDAGLKSSTRSAESNGVLLQKNLPAFMEYIDSLPSVHDLFRESVDATQKTQILYSDKDAELKGQPAYVFRPENKTSEYKVVDINDLLK